MTERTPRLALPWLMPAQAQKHVTVNEALARLDILVQAVVLSRTQSSQPTDPVDGEGYILPETVSGSDWSGQATGALMVYHEGVWTLITPWAGLGVYVRDEALNLVHDGASWRPLSDQIRQLDDQQGLGVGATADSYNRVVIKSPSVLMTAEDAGSGDMRLVMNKSAMAATASLLFQSGWSGRAEIGLAGDEALSIKVSDDGATWREGLRLEPDTGQVSLIGLRVQSDRVRIEQSHTPSSATAPGAVGEMCWDGGHVYVCVAQDQWRRATLSAW